MRFRGLYEFLLGSYFFAGPGKEMYQNMKKSYKNPFRGARNDGILESLD